MKITTTQLHKIIKEEVSKALVENMDEQKGSLLPSNMMAYKDIVVSSISSLGDDMLPDGFLAIFNEEINDELSDVSAAIESGWSEYATESSYNSDDPETQWNILANTVSNIAYNEIHEHTGDRFAAKTISDLVHSNIEKMAH